MRFAASILKASLRNLTLLFLAVAVSGSLAPAVQGWAWIEMAREAGGLHRIGEAMFEFAPCGRCHAAQALSQGTDEDSDRPGPSERPESLRFVATFEGTNVVPARPGVDLDAGYSRCRSEVSPPSRGDRPPVPPPRAVMASTLPA